MTTAMKPHQMLLVLLMLLFVASLPPCSSCRKVKRSFLGSSQFLSSSQLILSARYIQSLREARREAYSGKPGGWRVTNTPRTQDSLCQSVGRQSSETSRSYFRRCSAGLLQGMLATLSVLLQVKMITFKYA